MFLLDTDTIIYSLKGDPIVNQNISQYANEPMKICSATLMELYYGAYKSQMVLSNLAKVKAIEEAFEVLPIGVESVQIFGLLKANFEAIGKRLDDFDLIIAACAMAHNLILVSNNAKHYSRIEGLRLVSWT